METRFLTVDDVMRMLNVKSSRAYIIIRMLNKELADKGYMIQRGRVPKKYFLERYGVDG